MNLKIITILLLVFFISGCSTNYNSNKSITKNLNDLNNLDLNEFEDASSNNLDEVKINNTENLIRDEIKMAKDN